MTQGASLCRRWAERLTRHAGRTLPPGQQGWADAMGAEVAAIPGDGAALRWAAGCVGASYRERARDMGQVYGGAFLGLSGITAAVFGCYLVFGGVPGPVVLALPGSLLFILLGGVAVHTLVRAPGQPGLLSTCLDALRGTRQGKAELRELAAHLTQLLRDPDGRGLGGDDPLGGMGLGADGRELPAERLALLLQARIDGVAEARRQAVRALRAFASSLWPVGLLVAALGLVNLVAVYGNGGVEAGHLALLAATSLVAAILGLFLSHGVFGPLAQRAEAAIDADLWPHRFARDALVAHRAGLSPEAALRHANAGLPAPLALTAAELDAALDRMA